MIRLLIFTVAMLMTAFSVAALAQETIFNVPSGDILDKGRVYGEFDFPISGMQVPEPTRPV